MRKANLIFALCACPVLSFASGCMSPGDVADPKSISVQDALSQIGTGLHNLHTNAHEGDNTGSSFGLYVDEVTVTFNVQAQANQSGSLSLSANAAPPAIPGVSASASASATNSSQGTRGNTITLHFKNPIFATPGTLIRDIASTQPTKPEDAGTELQNLLKAASSNGSTAAARP